MSTPQMENTMNNVADDKLTPDPESIRLLAETLNKCAAMIENGGMVENIFNEVASVHLPPRPAVEVAQEIIADVGRVIRSCQMYSIA